MKDYQEGISFIPHGRQPQSGFDHDIGAGGLYENSWGDEWSRYP